MVRQERAKLGATVQLIKVTVTYADGHTQKHVGDDVRTFGIKIIDRPNPLSGIQLLDIAIKKDAPNALHLAGEKAHAQAAHFGESVVQRSSIVNIDDYSPDEFPKEMHAQVVISIKLDYTITVHRGADA